MCRANTFPISVTSCHVCPASSRDGRSVCVPCISVFARGNSCSREAIPDYQLEYPFSLLSQPESSMTDRKAPASSPIAGPSSGACEGAAAPPPAHAAAAAPETVSSSQFSVASSCTNRLPGVHPSIQRHLHHGRPRTGGRQYPHASADGSHRHAAPCCRHQGSVGQHPARHHIQRGRTRSCRA